MRKEVKRQLEELSKQDETHCTHWGVELSENESESESRCTWLSRHGEMQSLDIIRSPSKLSEEGSHGVQVQFVALCVVGISGGNLYSAWWLFLGDVIVLMIIMLLEIKLIIQLINQEYVLNNWKIF